MSDNRLRELERRRKTTGTVEDEAAFLRERVRAGELTQERLELAAKLGHPASQVVTGQHQLGGGLGQWCRQLAPHGQDVAVRAGVALARAAADDWAWRFPGFDPVRALFAAESWCACPCDSHAEAARLAGTEALRALADLADGGSPQPEFPASTFCKVAFMAAKPDDRSLTEGMPLIARVAAEASRVVSDSKRLRARAQAELVPWVLRSGDSVRERVCARGEACRIVVAVESARTQGTGS